MVHKEFKYDTVKELNEAIKGKSNIYVADDMQRLCRGWVIWTPSDSDEEMCEYHYAPIYPSEWSIIRDCPIKRHPSYKTYVRALNKCKKNKSDIYQADDIRRLRMGFVSYPECEYHQINLNLLHKAERDSLEWNVPVPKLDLEFTVEKEYVHEPQIVFEEIPSSPEEIQALKSKYIK